MKLDRFLRIAIAAVILLAFVVATAALLLISEAALNVWDRLRAGPPALLYAYVTVMLVLAATAVWLILQLVVRRSKPAAPPAAPLSKQEITERIREAEASGVDVSTAREELKALTARQGKVQLCFFGEISSGKSSLIKALVPEADVAINVVGGSTDAVDQYRWRNAGGDEILLIDVPGIGGTDGRLSAVAADEAKRSHVVLFVCDGDLTRPEMQAIEALIDFEKPLILVLNKADRFSADEQAALMQKLLERIDAVGGETRRDHVVAVTAGGQVDVVERGPDGSEQTVSEQRPADIGVLVVAINRLLAGDGLDERRERAIFRLAAGRLAEAEVAYRAQRAEQIIRSSTRKAVIGALAAISPGTDVLVQGYIGTTMTQELCRLYGAAPRDLDIEEFLTLSQSRVGRALPLSMAVAGNGLKAFPGIGTVAGGLVHAVAYGLIFDALGRSLVLTLTQHGALVPDAAAREFEEGISEHLEAGVRRIARLALEERRN